MPNWKTLVSEILLRIALVVCIIFLGYIKPVVRQVQSEDWKNYNYPKQIPPQVPNALLGVFVGVYWVFLFIICAVITYVKEVQGSSQLTYFVKPSASKTEVKEDEVISNKKAIKNALLLELYKLFLALSMVCILTVILTDILKNMVGRLRPDFLSTCGPAGFDPLQENYNVIGRVPKCTLHAEDPFDSRRSFPSGHSSYSMAVAFFTALISYNYYLKSVFSVSYRLIMSFTLIVPALWCGTSRIIDYRHHPTDVLAGFILGATVACLCYRCYYLIPKNQLKRKTEEEFREYERNEERTNRTLIGTKIGFIDKETSGQQKSHKNENKLYCDDTAV